MRIASSSGSLLVRISLADQIVEDQQALDNLRLLTTSTRLQTDQLRRDTLETQAKVEDLKKDLKQAERQLNKLKKRQENLLERGGFEKSSGRWMTIYPAALMAKPTFKRSKDEPHSGRYCASIETKAPTTFTLAKSFPTCV